MRRADDLSWTREPGRLPRRVLLAAILVAASLGTALGADLDEIRKSGKLRHLGIPYANFVTGSGDGMDVELVRLFAESLGLKYEYVRTDWGTVVGDLTGRKVKPAGDDVEFVGEAPVKGDLIASGMTVLPWRQKAVDFSSPTFPTQVWLIARADSAARPIRPTGDIEKDIRAARDRLRQRTVLCKKNTCLDPALYDLGSAEAQVRLFDGALNELAPALINGEAELLLLDMPDAIVALDKWPGRIKVIGPMTGIQDMAAAFRKDSPKLREAFNEFLRKCRKEGTYDRLVRNYYPSMADHFAGLAKWKQTVARRDTQEKSGR